MGKRIRGMAKEHADGKIDDYFEKEKYVKVGKRDLLTSDYDALKELTAAYGSTPEKEIEEKRVTIDDGRVVKYSIYTNLTKIPDAISKLTDIEELVLRCGLDYFPQEVLGLYYLRDLELFGNKITTIPDEIYRLENLRELHIQNNLLDSLPEGMSKMGKLEKLVVSGNKITKFPKGMSGMKKLKHFEMSHADLSEIPQELIGSKSLEKLHLPFNKIKSVTDEISSFEGLTHLNLMGNDIESLPDSMGNLRNLEEANLTSNAIKSLPEAMGGLDKLKLLSAAKNKIEHIPSSMDEFKGTLEIYDNPVFMADKNRISEKLKERVVLYDPYWDDYDYY